MKNFKIKILNSFSEELKDNWEEFESRSHHHIFQTYKWQKLWLEKQLEYKCNIKNYTVLVYENNELIMILPFNIKKQYSIKILSWSGFPFSDYNIPLMIRDLDITNENFKVIWKIILETIQDIDCIVLQNQPENIFNKKNPFYFFLNNKVNNESYGIKLDEEFNLKKNELENIKYQTNRLKKLGNLNFKEAKSVYEKKKILNFIIQHKSEQYIKTKAWNLFKNRFNKDFFILSSLTMEEKAYITYMELDNEIIAAHSGFVYNNICYYLFPVYNDAFNKYSPGKILLKKIIDDSKSNLLKYFDLTIGSENYKKNYSNSKFYSSAVLKSFNLKGYLFIFLLTFKDEVKKFLKGLKFKN